MIYNRLFHNRFLREEAIPGSEGEGPGGGAPPPASPVDSPPPANPPVPPNPYDFSGGAEQPVPDPGSTPPLSPQEETEYEIDFGEGFVENDALRDMLKGHARAAGLPADAAGKFLSEVAASIRADEEEAFKEADEALKDEWGAEYETNVSAAKAFARKLSVESGVSMENMAVFATDRFRRRRILPTRLKLFCPTPITVIIRRSPILRIHSGGRLPIIIISWWGFPVSFLR